LELGAQQVLLELEVVTCRLELSQLVVVTVAVAQVFLQVQLVGLAAEVPHMQAQVAQAILQQHHHLRATMVVLHQLVVAVVAEEQDLQDLQDQVTLQVVLAVMV
jgi:hypothetical protein